MILSVNKSKVLQFRYIFILNYLHHTYTHARTHAHIHTHPHPHLETATSKDDAVPKKRHERVKGACTCALLDPGIDETCEGMSNNNGNTPSDQLDDCPNYKYMYAGDAQVQTGNNDNTLSVSSLDNEGYKMKKVWS